MSSVLLNFYKTSTYGFTPEEKQDEDMNRRAASYASVLSLTALQFNFGLSSNKCAPSNGSILTLNPYVMLCFVPVSRLKLLQPRPGDSSTESTKINLTVTLE